MGQGAHLLIANHTECDWKKADEYTYQMDGWGFPDVIKKGESYKVYIEWDENIFHAHSDDEGKVKYVFQDQQHSSIWILAANKGEYKISVDSTEVKRENEKTKHSICDLGWIHDGTMLYDVAGSDAAGYVVTGDDPMPEYYCMHKSWQDETAGSSAFQGLNLPGDRYWKKGRITVKGRYDDQEVDINLFLDGEQLFANTVSIKKDQVKMIDFYVDGMKTISVSGALKINGVKGASAVVDLDGWYEEEETLKNEQAHWEDETGGMSMIEGLCLEGDHQWEKCEIKLEGRKDRATKCTVTLIAGGNIVNPLYEPIILNGTEERIYSYDLNKKEPLVVAGFIGNADIIGSGAKITLTGYYKEK